MRTEDCMRVTRACAHESNTSGIMCGTQHAGTRRGLTETPMGQGTVALPSGRSSPALTASGARTRCGAQRIRVHIVACGAPATCCRRPSLGRWSVTAGGRHAAQSARARLSGPKDVSGSAVTDHPAAPPSGPTPACTRPVTWLCHCACAAGRYACKSSRRGDGCPPPSPGHTSRAPCHRWRPLC